MTMVSDTSTPVGAERTLTGDFDEIVERTVAALKDEGFGVLCDIDVKATFKEKLDIDREDYRILGACNPPLAHEALGQAPELGVLLPCNVVVRRDGDEVQVQAVDPFNLLGLLPPNTTLSKVADDVDQRLQRALDAL